MKKPILLLVSAFIAVATMAQSPALINYQGVARNSVGNVLPNTNITLRLSVREGASNGIVVYQETRTLKTNFFGMFTVAIGGAGATSVSGALGSVNWATGGAKFLEVEMDPKGGNNFINMGSSQLLSVPYALHAGSALPGGPAGGALTGTFPNPGIADGAVSTQKIADNSVTAAKLAPGVIPAFLPPGGPAGGDLSGTFPNPTVANNAIDGNKLADDAVTTSKVADGSITAAKIAAGVIPAFLPPGGAAGGDLTGTFPNPTINANAVDNSKIADNAVNGNKIADDAITTSKVADGSITAAKLAAGVIPAFLPPGGAAGGDLSGTYPNPTIAANAVDNSKIADDAVSSAKIVDGSVTAAKLAAGVIPTTLPPSGPAGGDLTGTYPNPTIADDAITTNKIADGSVTVAKLAAGIVGGSTPTGAAGGDLSGTYPNPTINANAVDNSKLADDAVTTSKIADNSVDANKLADDAVTTTKILDGSVTAAKLAGGVIPTSLPPSGAAAGDLGGTYPSPSVIKIQGIDVSATAPASGDVLKFDGTSWVPGGAGFTLPFTASLNDPAPLVGMINAGTGQGFYGENSSNLPNVSAIEGVISETQPGANSAALKGINHGGEDNGVGVWGIHDGNGAGVFGTSVLGYGVYGISENGTSGKFEIINNGNPSDAMVVSTMGTGNGLVGYTITGVGAMGVASNYDGTGLMGVAYDPFGGDAGDGVNGTTQSSTKSGIHGINYGTFAAVFGESGVPFGVGVQGRIYSDFGGGGGGDAIVGEVFGDGPGNTALFKANGVPVARIDETGKGYFNGGTQMSGADVAEYFDVEGSRNNYEPGDVLTISANSDRAVEKSSTPYSTLVAGVYATKPGVLLTEHNAEQNRLQHMVPMGVIGVIPTKVCNEGGAIKRGDLLVTSSIPGVAMKADLDKVRVGQVLGKALQDFNGTTGKINVLVSVK